MEKEFIPYEQALALKELGFDEPCFARYYKAEPHNIQFVLPNYSKDFNEKQFLHNKEVVLYYSAPLYQQAFSFFREKYELDGWVVPYLKLNGSKVYSYIIDGADYDEEDCELNTHEEAELECLRKLIEIVKEK
jgi:hypothetical protein